VSAIQQPLFRGVFPKEVALHTLSFLESQDLGKAQLVCREWKELAGDDDLWQDLFTRAYKEPIPEGKSGKEACKMKSAKTIGNKEKLQRVVTSFLCHLKWNTKRRLECTFPNEPTYSLIIERSFGPDRGTEKGFKGPADETEYYKYMARLRPGQPATFSCVYPKRSQTSNLDCAKVPGFDDRKSVHIPNIDRLAIVEPRELSRDPNSKSEAVLGITSKSEFVGSFMASFMGFCLFLHLLHEQQRNMMVIWFFPIICTKMTTFMQKLRESTWVMVIPWLVSQVLITGKSLSISSVYQMEANTRGQG
jgi:hypothetical protein